MAESLRGRQKRLTRQLILTATADEIVEQGLAQLSLQEVAKRAGVSNMTLYNHFDNRETLLVELNKWADELAEEISGPVELPTDIRELPAIIGRVWHTWDELGTLFEALIQIWSAVGTNQIEHYAEEDRAHAEKVGRSIELLRPRLEPEEVAAIAGVVRTLASPGFYHRMKTHYKVPSDPGGRAVAWALQLVIDALAAGDDPFRD